jgi:glycosyltransferase involved in cell wall biosynthesis
MAGMSATRVHVPTTGAAFVTARPNVAVIIPAFNAAGTLGVQLEALSHQDYDGPWEVIVVDNGSTDATVAVARSYASLLPLKTVDARALRGPGYARNVGVQASRAPRLAFVDADDEVGRGWLAAMVQAIDDHGVVASRFDLDRLNSTRVRDRRAMAQERGLGTHNYVPYLPHVSASGLGVLKKIHDAIGGFDPQLRVLEDTDYCWRLQLSGYSIHFEPDALVHYRLRATTAASLRQSFNYGRFNGYLYLRYRRLGMEPVSLVRDLRRLGVHSVRLLSAAPDARAQRLRSLANLLGIVIGRAHGSVLVSLGVADWLVGRRAERPSAPAATN